MLRTILGFILLFCFFETHARLFGQVLCQYDGFYCHKIKKNESWRSLFPDEHVRDIVMRINRLNIQLWRGMTIAIPDNPDGTDIMDYTPFELTIAPPGEKEVIIDPVFEAWAAYDAQGNLVRWGPASSGRAYCKDIDKPCYTHEGSYRVFSLGSSDCFSTKFPVPDGGAPMPYCMYFNNGQALHGEPNGLPGYNASHGCVRLYVNDAEWLRYDFVEMGTKIVVKPYS